MMKVPEEFRVTTGALASTKSEGNNGAFMVRSLKLKRPLFVIASDGMGWEHVSVSLPDRVPTWKEMCFIKGLFWGPNDCVIQYHPPESEYVNNHQHCLHLWRPVDQEIPMPPSIMVGIKEQA